MFEEFGKILQGALMLEDVAKRRIQNGDYPGAVETLELMERSIGQSLKVVKVLAAAEAAREECIEQVRKSDASAYRWIAAVCGVTFVELLVLIGLVVWGLLR